MRPDESLFVQMLHPTLFNTKRSLFDCLSGKKTFTEKVRLTYSEFSFSAEIHADNLKILTAAQRAGISTSFVSSNVMSEYMFVILCRVSYTAQLIYPPPTYT